MMVVIVCEQLRMAFFSPCVGGTVKHQLMEGVQISSITLLTRHA